MVYLALSALCFISAFILIIELQDLVKDNNAHPYNVPQKEWNIIAHAIGIAIFVFFGIAVLAVAPN